ncbi:MAG: thiolase family protein [Bacillota bacterium]
MDNVYVIGVGMTPFGRYLDKKIRDLAGEAITEAIQDARISRELVQAVWFSNSGWGYFDNQHCIRGQVALRHLGFAGLPIVNVENACASGSTAFHSAWTAVKAGLYDCVLAVGAEKVYNTDREKMFKGFFTGVDVENIEVHFNMLSDIKRRVNFTVPAQSEEEAGKSKSAFMDIYASMCHWHMGRFGSTQEQLAVISSKNHFHGSLNPKAQIRKKMTVEKVLAERLIAWPLTLPMCAPVGDGAAAAILCSENFLKKLDKARAVKIRASVLGTGTDRDLDEPDIGFRVSRKAYEMAGVEPKDINLAEVHDASAYGELHQTEVLGFCPEGEGGIFAESGATILGGKMPVNTSGGLESRGHPIGASGLAQIYELVTQLRGEAGERQVHGARLALAENGGGNIGYEEAAMCVHILEKV